MGGGMGGAAGQGGGGQGGGFRQRRKEAGAGREGAETAVGRKSPGQGGGPRAGGRGCGGNGGFGGVAQMLYVFGLQSGKLEHIMACHDKEPIGLCHHPHKNVLASFASDSALKLWRP